MPKCLHKNKNRCPYDIAIVSMAGLLPGANSLDEFWENLVRKIGAYRSVGEDRWRIDPDAMVNGTPQPDKAYSKTACLLGDIEFNLNDLNLEKSLINSLDPLYRIVLHTAREAFYACRHETVDRQRTGVILAAIALPTDSSTLISKEILLKPHVKDLFVQQRKTSGPALSSNQCLAGRVTGFPAALVAQGLGLGGGSFTLDAACASSLVALKLACDELASHRADAMLAGGVSRPDCLYTQVGFSQLRALSPSGCCAPFDKNADGLVVGEGAGIFMLKRLADAVNDQDSILGVIRGIGLSNDIEGNLLAPSSEGQIRSMQSAYRMAGWRPDDVDLIECHGAGTPLGDQTEIQSLRTLWNNIEAEDGQCPIGSVKSMIGHLLTGAGAAGTIKVLMAMQHRKLPPSLNFSGPPSNSPLWDSPFRVQTETEEWQLRNANTPRRAAVSAFGFGGINAHLLLEAWQPENKNETGIHPGVGAHGRLHEPAAIYDKKTTAAPKPLVAIVGMDAAFSSLQTLREFQESIFNGDTAVGKRPPSRWKGNAETWLPLFKDGVPAFGAYMSRIMIELGEFHIPPNEIPEILPQHLLMLKLAKQALMNAGLPLREARPRMGVVIGANFDFEATNYHLRWMLRKQITNWKRKHHDVCEDPEIEACLTSLKSFMALPLTADRTLGALTGVIASRIAKSFLLGGSSYVVSCEEASGIHALSIGVRSLQEDETDAMIVGAVDLPGDIRSMVSKHLIAPFASGDRIAPFDHSAEGTLPGEGGAAIILKRLEDAMANGDRIYAVIKGFGFASGQGSSTGKASSEDYQRSLENAFLHAGVDPGNVSLFEAHGSGIVAEDFIEFQALDRFFKASSTPCAIGAVKPMVGHAGAASGLCSVVKAGLCLYNEIIPPLPNYRSAPQHPWRKRFHMPLCPQYWFRNRMQGPKTACVGAMTDDGNFAHVVLEAYEADRSEKSDAIIPGERKRPLGYHPWGLFSVEGNDADELAAGLDSLQKYFEEDADTEPNFEMLAREWHEKTGADPDKKLAVSLMLRSMSQANTSIRQARQGIYSDLAQPFHGHKRIQFSRNPLGRDHEIAFVFPGSGNHYLGMGRRIATYWPDILRRMDAETESLISQMLPERFMPYRASWENNWEREAESEIHSHPLYGIIGQVMHSTLMAYTIQAFGIRPDAVIGYSLGEPAGLFAMGAWRDKDEMLKRMLASPLFKTELTYPFRSLRHAWRIDNNQAFSWRVAVVDRPSAAVRQVIERLPLVRLLVVNSPKECVIGGEETSVKTAINLMNCHAVYLDGVATVHCDAITPVADAYQQMHMLPVKKMQHMRFYSASWGKLYTLTSKNAAESILSQATSGFNFMKVIQTAYQDGVRIFLEMGPQASCTRMIHQILEESPHVAISADKKGKDAYESVLRMLGCLIAERIWFDHDKLYGESSYPPDMNRRFDLFKQRHALLSSESYPKKIVIPIGGGHLPVPDLSGIPCRSSAHAGDAPGFKKLKTDLECTDRMGMTDEKSLQSPEETDILSEITQNGIASLQESASATAEAHKAYLELSHKLTKAQSRIMAMQQQLLSAKIQDAARLKSTRNMAQAVPDSGSKPVFSREDCMEFATGAVANVFGPEFAVIDTYPARVRLPDEPLMLVDRVTAIEGEKRSLKNGRIVTEHDVLPDAWYLDGNRAPVCISVEAGQADLFLSSYLGIDHAVKGQRTYRLLDATVSFFRGLPKPGETIRYVIDISKFIRQRETYLFFFSFKGFIGDNLLIQMKDGCAGFFTEAEVKNSGGIIGKIDDAAIHDDVRTGLWRHPAPISSATFSDDDLNRLREGHLEACFGRAFQGKYISTSLWLPGGRMHLIDRILKFDPYGGVFGLGLIRAQADVHPDDWYLTCHFVDDMVMPGTLMYECCAHTLRVFLQRIGWITDKKDACYEPVIGVESILKCRGPVTPKTQQVVYEIEIKELGYSPEPYAIADAHMYIDNAYSVRFDNISMKMSHVTQGDIESLWSKPWEETGQIFDAPAIRTPAVEADHHHKEDAPPLFTRTMLEEFASGLPSRAFGQPYEVFDTERFIARLPRPPYLFIDRVIRSEPEPWVLKPDGWIEAVFDVDPDAWYFHANRIPVMPFCVLNEIALQPCGWLAAYMGSALKKERDLRFRNLGGEGIVHSDVLPKASKLTTRARLTCISEAGDMIIEQFDFEILQSEKMIYEGNTTFGFFTEAALAKQVGLKEVDSSIFQAPASRAEKGKKTVLAVHQPLRPGERLKGLMVHAAMPGKAIQMIDRIDAYSPDGGPKELGYISVSKTVDPTEWFFRAHFFQDPVCPGSLGIESLMQVLKYAAMQRWPHLVKGHCFSHASNVRHQWTYRGQITPLNKTIELESVITRAVEKPIPMLYADGLLKVDGLAIYKMENFGIGLIKHN